MIKNVLLQDLTLARSNLQKFNVANEELGRSCRGQVLHCNISIRHITARVSPL